MQQKLEELDIDLFFLINDCHNPFFDDVMFIISWKFTWVPLYIYFLYLIYKKQNLKTLIISLIAVVLLITLADQISVQLFKNVFLRYRPTHNLDHGDFVHYITNFKGEPYKGGKYGFVSSHATNSFALAMFLGLLFQKINPRLLWILFGWASIVGYSRIYLGVHYPADVFCGALLGIFIGFIVSKIQFFVLKKSKLINK